MIIMITLEKLQIWGLTRNQAKLLQFFVENRHRKDLSYKIIKEEIKSKKSFYREVLQDLIERKFLYILKDNRPITYHFNHNRFRELFQEYQYDFYEKQQDFEILFKKLKETKDYKEFLGLAKPQLRLADEQILILTALLSKFKREDKINAMTLKEINENLDGKIASPTIRYNLALLEKRGIIEIQKIGRTNYYRSKDLRTILEIEQKFQLKLWNEKKKIMQKIIQHFQKEPKKELKKTKNFRIIENFNNIKNDILDLIKNAKKEILLDFRCRFRPINVMRDFLGEILNELLEKSQRDGLISIKLILEIDDWLIHKLDYIFLPLITGILPNRFEIRVPIERELKEFRIVVDEKTLYQIIGANEVSPEDYGVEINNITTVTQTILSIKQIWENSLDIRDSIIEYTLDREIEREINRSIKKYPPKYNFSNSFLTIRGLRKCLRFMLRLFANAKNEILVIVGPVFQSTEGEFSVLEILSKENYYNELNTVIEKRVKAGVFVKWIRNTISPHLKIYQTDEAKKSFMDLVLNMNPLFQMRQLQLEQYQFSIIDQKILLIFDYFNEKMTIILDPFVINKYNILFQSVWSEAYDIRLQWLTEISKPLKKYIKNSFENIRLQINMPKEGKIRKFSGQFLKPILNFLLRSSKQEVYALRTYSPKVIKNKKEFLNQIIPYFFEFINAAKNHNFKMKVNLTYFPEFLELPNDEELKSTLDIFPRFQIHLLPNNIQSNAFFGIFDNYLLTFLGNTDLDDFHLLIINAENLNNYYKEQFKLLWDDSVDLRQLYLEYGTEKQKKLVLKSIKKHKLKKQLSSDQIRQKYPMKR